MASEPQEIKTETPSQPAEQESTPILDKIKELESQEEEQPQQQEGQKIDTSKIPIPKTIDEARKLTEIRKSEAELPFLEQQAQLKAREQAAKTQKAVLEAEQARKQKEEEENFLNTPRGRDLRKLQKEAQVKSEIAQAKARADQSAQAILQSRALTQQAKAQLEAAERQRNAPRLEQLQKLFTPQAIPPAAYQVAQQPGATEVQPAYANVNPIQVRQQANQQTGQQEYYLEDTGATRAQQLGGSYALNHGISPQDTYSFMGGTGIRAFQQEASVDPAQIFSEIGGKTPYGNYNQSGQPHPSQPVVPPLPPIPRAVSAPPPIQPVPLPQPAPKPIIIQQVPQPAARPPARKPEPRLVVVKPEIKVHLPKGLLGQKARVRKHASVGRPRAQGRVSKKALRERERRRRIKLEKLKLRG